MKFAVKTIVAVAALAASGLTLADSQTNTGFYLAIDAGQATLSPSIDLGQTGDGSVGTGTWSQDDEHNATVSLGIGYAFNDYVSIELGYTSYGDTKHWEDPLVNSDPNTPDPTLLTDDFITEITDIQSVNLNVLVGMPMGENFNVYLRGGYQAWDMDVKASSLASVTTDDWNKVGINYGFGFKLDMTDNLSLRNEYMWHNFDDDDIDLDTQTITLGLVYTF